MGKEKSPTYRRQLTERNIDFPRNLVNDRSRMAESGRVLKCLMIGLRWLTEEKQGVSTDFKLYATCKRKTNDRRLTNSTLVYTDEPMH